MAGGVRGGPGDFSCAGERKSAGAVPDCVCGADRAAEGDSDAARGAGAGGPGGLGDAFLRRRTTPEARQDLAAYKGRTPLTAHGSVSQGELAEGFRQGSVLVLPSLEEGFGLVVPQALNCGLPCIVSDRVGGKDLIRHRENGSIFPCGDAAALGGAGLVGGELAAGEETHGWDGPAEADGGVPCGSRASAVAMVADPCGGALRSPQAQMNFFRSRVAGNLHPGEMRLPLSLCDGRGRQLALLLASPVALFHSPGQPMNGSCARSRPPQGSRHRQPPGAVPPRGPRAGRLGPCPAP